MSIFFVGQKEEPSTSIHEADDYPYKNPPGAEEGDEQMNEMVWTIVMDNHMWLLENKKKTANSHGHISLSVITSANINRSPNSHNFTMRHRISCSFS